MPTPSVSRPPAYSQDLAELILERCAARASGPGSRLPTERQLADDLGVTRTMVRHALALLEAEGRISREVGRGTFLRGGDSRHAPPRANRDVSRPGDVGPADVMAARRLIEPQVLPLVVAWATARDFDEMRRCIAGGAGGRQLRRVRGVGLRATPRDRRGQPQPAAGRDVPRGGARAEGRAVGEPEAPQRLPRAARRLPGRPRAPR